MIKFTKILIPTYFIVLFLNQTLYGSCYQSYCLSAAFPKVTIISVIISYFIFKVIKSESDKSKK